MANKATRNTYRALQRPDIPDKFEAIIDVNEEITLETINSAGEVVTTGTYSMWDAVALKKTYAKENIQALSLFNAVGTSPSRLKRLHTNLSNVLEGRTPGESVDAMARITGDMPSNMISDDLSDLSDLIDELLLAEEGQVEARKAQIKGERDEKKRVGKSRLEADRIRSKAQLDALEEMKKIVGGP